MKGFFNPSTLRGKGGRKLPSLPQCGRCGLYKECNSPKMTPTGKGKRRILFVGESPGEKEDATGVQLVGKSGIYLRKVLRSLKVELDDCVKTNAVICRAPKNQVTDVHITSCRPNLLKTIREYKPTVIVLLGGAAVRGLIPTERDADVGSITRWVGWRIPSHEHQAWICPTYHPAFVLRQDDPVLDLLFREHITGAIKLEKKKVRGSYSLDALKGKVERIFSPKLARARLRDLAKKRGVLAFDYECTGIKPENPLQKIVSVSFCFEGEDTFSLLVDDSVKEGISRVLQSKKLKKVASNLKYEERWTRAKLGHPVSSWFWDTMLAAHVLDNREGITSLKFLAFRYFGVADYDKDVESYFETQDSNGLNRCEEIPKEDLLLYNGLDSLLEFMVMKKQREEMGLRA